MDIIPNYIFLIPFGAAVFMVHVFLHLKADTRLHSPTARALGGRQLAQEVDEGKKATPGCQVRPSKSSKSRAICHTKTGTTTPTFEAYGPNLYVAGQNLEWTIVEDDVAYAWVETAHSYILRKPSNGR